jgi:hypothetical protein
MPGGWLKTRQDIEDFVRGCVFYGTGGGGLPESGVKTLADALGAGRKIGWVDCAGVPDDALVASAFLNGTISTPTPEESEELAALGLSRVVHGESGMLQQALRELSGFLGRKIAALVPPEIGAANGPGPLALGATAGLPVVDGDYAGRSVPEVRNTTFCMSGKSLFPLACVDRFGNTTILKSGASLGALERLAKLLAVSSCGLAGQASFVLTGREMKETLIPGTLTMCFTLGRFIRESQKRKVDVPRLITEYLEGWILIEGVVGSREEKKTAGCLSGTISVSGGAKELRIWYRNESHLAWLDGRPAAMSPDLISVVKRGSGEPTIHARLAPGDEVAVIGVRAHELLRTPAGIESLGPKHWGFDLEYAPIEELAKKAPYR